MLSAQRRAGLALIAGLALPTWAHASNFGVLLFVAYGLCAVAGLVLGFIAYHLANSFQSPWARACVWGAWAALMFTPMSTHGGNGTLQGSPILALVFLLFGGDPVYGAAALKALLVSMPLCTAVLWVFLRQSKKPSGGAEDT